MKLRKVLHAKIHRLTITHADVNYEGSISLPPELLAAAHFAEGEAVWLWNVTTGTRLETYTICGKAGSGIVAVNGAAAHLMRPGEVIIVAAFTFIDEESIASHIPRVVFVDEHNKVREIRSERPGPRA